MGKLAKKIVFTGPESSGKTVLSKWAAQHFGDAWSGEFSRQFLEKTSGKYTAPDLERIAAGQLRLEKKALKKAKDFLFCDTDLTVVEVWQEHKFGQRNPKISKLLRQSLGDFYFLLSPDLAWEFDPLREAESQAERDLLFQKYEQLLTGLGVPFVVVGGEKMEREQAVIWTFDNWALDLKFNEFQWGKAPAK